MTLDAIKEAISQLPAAAKTQLSEWLLEQDMKDWDRQIEQDFSAGGRGMALLEEAESDIREGRVKPMDEVLANANAGRKTQPKSGR